MNWGIFKAERERERETYGFGGRKGEERVVLGLERQREAMFIEMK